MTRPRLPVAGLPLTPREKDVLVAVVNNAPRALHGGVPARTIAAAAAIGVSRNTARRLLDNAAEKLGARSTEHAVALAYPQLADRYLETPERRRMAALAYDILQHRGHDAAA